MTWIRQRDLRILAVGKYTYASDLRFEAMHQQGNTEWILRIRRLVATDRGLYECQINTKPIKSFTVELNIVGGFTYAQNSSCNLECNSTTSRAPGCYRYARAQGEATGSRKPPVLVRNEQ